MVDGKRRHVYGETKAEAMEKLDALKRQAQAGMLVEASKQTVAQYFEYWMEVHSLEISDNTVEHYQAYIHARILPGLGAIKLQKLSREHLQKFVGSMVSDQLEPGTIKLIFSIIRTALSDAVEWQYIGRNPCKGVVLPQIEEAEYPVLDFKQVQVLLDAVSGTKLEGLVTVALCTGLRRGELLGLKWADIDRGKWTLTVQRTLIYLNGVGYREVGPKTKASKRTIPLIPLAQVALEKHRTRQLKARMEAEIWKEKDLVFCDGEGDYMNFATLYRAFYKVLAQAELPPMRIHDLRHSAATLLLALKVSIKVIQAILGHSSLMMTLGLYGHLLPGATDQEMDIFQRALQPFDDVDEEAN